MTNPGVAIGQTDLALVAVVDPVTRRFSEELAPLSIEEDRAATERALAAAIVVRDAAMKAAQDAAAAAGSIKPGAPLGVAKLDGQGYVLDGSGNRVGAGNADRAYLRATILEKNGTYPAPPQGYGFVEYVGATNPESVPGLVLSAGYTWLPL